MLKSLGGRIPLIVDAGPTQRGLESTIVAATGGRSAFCGADRSTFRRRVEADSGRIEAPGQLASHYAPSKPLRLNAQEAAEGEFLIGFSGVDGDANLSPSGDLVEAAARLFDLLHVADESDKPRIAVAPVPIEGLGAAINDRLRRAAVPR